MITRVRLRNWKSHMDSSFSFSKGVNALVGIMGSGKSSVTDAISFGLFGSLPALQTRKLTLDQLIMERPQSKPEASVEIEFLASGKSYCVKRDIKRGKGSSAEIRENGELREVSSRGVTKEVERLLEMDYDVFSKAVYSEQNGLDFFLKIPVGKRREHIDRMLRVDRFETVRIAAVSIQNRLKISREEKLRITAEMEKENSEGKLREVEEETAALKEQIDLLGKEREALLASRKDMEANVSVVEEKQRELEETKRLLEGLKGGLEEIQKREGRCRKTVRGKDLGKIDIEIQQLERVIEVKKQQVDYLKEGLHDFSTRKKLASESLEGIQKFEGTCPLCESDISSEKKERLAEGKTRLLENLDEEIAKKHALVFEEEKELASLGKNLEDRVVERERASQAFQEIREMGSKLTEILDVKKKYEEEIASLEVPGSDITSLRTQLQDTSGKEREAAVKIHEMGKRLEDREESIKELEQRISLFNEYKTELAKEEMIGSQLERFGQALKRTQEELRTEFLTNVNLLLEMVWSELYPYGDFSSVRLAVEEGDYVLQLRSGEWIDAEAVSGGERSLASLALRVAFSLAFLPNLKWLILDEPTHNLDSNAIAAFSEALKERLPSFAEQIFLITHDSSLSEGLENVYQLERDKDAGESTIVKTVDQKESI